MSITWEVASAAVRPKTLGGDAPSLLAFDRERGHIPLAEALTDGWEPFAATYDPTGSDATLVWLRRLGRD